MISGNNNTFFFQFSKSIYSDIFLGARFLVSEEQGLLYSTTVLHYNVVFNQFDYYIM